MATATIPFTPRLPRDRRQDADGRAFAELAGTIASARRIPRDAVLRSIEDRDDDEPESSFLAEDNYHSRPLASRVASSSAVPDRAARRVSSTATATGARGERRPSIKAQGKRREEPRARAMGGGGEGGADDLERDAERLRLGEGDDVEEDEDEADQDPKSRLEGVPLAVQEAWVCEDLGYFLKGIQGDLIRYHPEYDPLDEECRLRGVRWTVDPGLDQSLMRVVERILPIATYYTGIDAFMELRHEASHGMANHALVSGMRDMLTDYDVLTSRLESMHLTSPDFTLQTAFLHLHPAMHALAVLYALCRALDWRPRVESDEGSDSEDSEAGAGFGAGRVDEAAKKGIIGGEVLGIIVERGACMNGDPSAASVYAELLVHASQPYARMLLEWISTGDLHDPYDEFMIKVSGQITKGRLAWDMTDDYWDRRYTLRDGSSLASAADAGGLGVARGPAKRPGTNRLPGGACIPAFLEPWKHKILLAGKYLNVIRECGTEVRNWDKEEREQASASAGADDLERVRGESRVASPVVSATPGSSTFPDGLIRMNDVQFYRRIESAYIYANRKLLTLMLKEQELLPCLRSMKHFFFLDQSEFLNQFLDTAFTELRKPVQSASMTKIQSLLYMAVSNPASASSLDPHKESLKVTLSSESLFDYLIRITSPASSAGHFADLARGKGGIKKEDKPKKEILTIDALQFDFEVKFPLNLVISRKTITRYQLIFRFLLALRHLELSLTNMWLEHKTPLWRRNSGDSEIEKWKRRIYSLRAQMLQWVQHVVVFATSSVLEANWKILESRLEKVQTVDQLLRFHVEYLDACLKECMLTVEKLLTVTSKLVATISTFTLYQPQLSRALTKCLADPKTEATAEKMAARWTILEKFESHFRYHVTTHFDVVTYFASSDIPALLALAARLTELRTDSV